MECELGLVSQMMSLESFVAFHWSFVFFVWMCNALDLGFLLVLTGMRVSSGVSSRREFRVRSCEQIIVLEACCIQPTPCGPGEGLGFGVPVD
jgi:hypothetical protein